MRTDDMQDEEEGIDIDDYCEELPIEKCDSKDCKYWDDGCILDASSKCIYDD